VGCILKKIEKKFFYKKIIAQIELKRNSTFDVIFQDLDIFLT
tara:strand:+ start:1683 stop:1808 length:126 start_codon:yes stop_codon:yes gene_type:complete